MCRPALSCTLRGTGVWNNDGITKDAISDFTCFTRETRFDKWKKWDVIGCIETLQCFTVFMIQTISLMGAYIHNNLAVESPTWIAVVPSLNIISAIHWTKSFISLNCRYMAFQTLVVWGFNLLYLELYDCNEPLSCEYEACMCRTLETSTNHQFLDFAWCDSHVACPSLNHDHIRLWRWEVTTQILPASTMV